MPGSDYTAAMGTQAATPPKLSPFDEADLRERVQLAIDAVLGQEAARLTAIDTDLLPLVEALTALLAGAKDYGRPLLLGLARGFGRRPTTN